MVSTCSAFKADAVVTGQALRLSVTALSANGSTPSTRFRDLPISALVGTHEERCAIVRENVVNMWGDVIADEVCSQSVGAVVNAFNQAGINFVP